MYRPKIALMGSLTESKKMISVNMDYLRAVWHAGGVGVLLPMTENEHLIDEYAKEFDGFLFCGGVDIDPSYYNEPKDERTVDICPERDRFEYLMFHAVHHIGKPILGICRGEQVINVFMGGKLCQHIDGHRQSSERAVHEQKAELTQDGMLYRLLGQEKILTNSFHHQVVSTLADGLVCDAVSDDGYIEAYHEKEHMVLLGVQWHPECYHHLDETSSKIFAAFIDAARQAISRKEELL